MEINAYNSGRMLLETKVVQNVFNFKSFGSSIKF